MFYDILDKKRLEILPFLRIFKEEFYLAGGTALALQIGHRDSVDFDFFAKTDIDTDNLFLKIKEVFFGFEIVKIQEDKNTLTVLIDKAIKLSFFSYKYDLLKSCINEDNLCLASIKDIACMKLSTILSRGTNKDYIDLYYIFKNYDFKEILILCQKKFKDIDINLILKSLVYFDDIDHEPINFKHENEISFEQVKKFLKDLIRDNSKLLFS